MTPLEYADDLERTVRAMASHLLQVEALGLPVMERE